MEIFAALRFTEDENLAGRVYWYIAPFPVKDGERVFAPVGPHDRLQLARVERTEAFSEEEAPYPAILCKRILARENGREVKEGVFDLGGVRYDDRHYTRFHRLLIAKREADGDGLAVKRISVDEEGWLFAAAEEGTCALLYGGTVKEAASLILRIVRGEDVEEVSPSVLISLRQKMR